MNPTPELSTPEEIQKRSGYQSIQPVQRPDYWGVDLDMARRPGVPMMSQNPQPLPNTRFPPEQQPGTPASPMHGRPNKTMPPVFGTTVPLRGLSGAIRKLAYSYPDHYPRHWLLKMLGDRVDSWEYRARKVLPVVVPLAVLGFVARRSLGPRAQAT
ncbi:MAG TPA: hypothetical protein VF794_08365 [Archangium sp.]|jgi:hypothetical protein|uniref:hypothetical protein n=1 Tax=Archangium sp. TaxID=1872627 RepID=UPI002ED7780C